MASCLPVEQWCIPLIPELSGQRQEHLCDFETILVYIARLCLKNKMKQNKQNPSLCLVLRQESYDALVPCALPTFRTLSCVLAPVMYMQKRTGPCMSLRGSTCRCP